MKNVINKNDYVNGRTFAHITRNVNKLISANIKYDDFTAKNYKFTAGQIKQYKRLGFIEKTGEVFSDKMICINKEEELYKKVKVGTYKMVASNAEMMNYLKALKKERNNYNFNRIERKIEKLEKEIAMNGFRLENFNLKAFC